MRYRAVIIALGMLLAAGCVTVESDSRPQEPSRSTVVEVQQDSPCEGFTAEQRRVYQGIAGHC